MPDAITLLIYGASAAALLLALAVLRSGRRGGPMLTQTRPLPQMKGSLGAGARRRGAGLELGEEVYNLLEAGRRAEALKLVWERTDLGPEEAEELMAKLEKWKKRLES